MPSLFPRLIRVLRAINDHGSWLVEDLDHGSKLEYCSFIGDMRRDGLLTKAPKKMWEFDEIHGTVPLMTLSFVVQRLVHAATVPLQQENVELRQVNTELRQENTELKAERADQVMEA